MSHDADHTLIDELLDRWEEHAEKGKPLSLEELCRDCPELTEEVQRRIRLLSATEWMAGGESAIAEPSVRSDGSTSESGSEVSGKLSPGSGVQPASLTADEFTSSLCSSGLLTPKELQQLYDTSTISSEDTPEIIAEALVEHGRLTTWQAGVVLEQGADPLLVDRYIILDVLGSGGMGVVFKALHKSMDRVVALKMLPTEMVNSEDKVTRFQREMKATARLSHPNVVTVFDASESAGSHFLAMEYVPGPNLATYVKRNGTMSVAQAVRCITQAAAGLQHAHENGVVHRDVKPANLLLAPDGQIKVADMGLAALDASSGLEQLASSLTGGLVLGTIAYISPEQATESDSTDARADIYSLGSTLHYLLTARPPFKEKTPIKTLLAHRQKPIPRLQDERDDVPPELDAVFQRMLAKRVDERFQSMSEVVTALETVPVDSGSESSLIVPTETDADTNPVTSYEAVTQAWQANSQKADPSPITAVSRRSRFGGLITIGVVILAAIIVVITNRDGSRTTITVPNTSTVDIVNNDDSGTRPRDAIEAQAAHSETELAAPHHDAERGKPYTNSIGMKFAWLPKGTFPMSGGSGRAGTMQAAILHDFYMGVYEVTQGEWESVTGENPSYFSPSGDGAEQVAELTADQLKQLPVENVNWYESLNFTRQLTEQLQPADGWVYRLPTQAEWEYACRGGPGHDSEHYGYDFYFDTGVLRLTPALVNCAASDIGRTVQAGSYGPNATGLYDMHGNVREWCLDLIYLSPKNATRPRRIARGGAWNMQPVSASARNYLPASDRHGGYGLRIVLAPPVEVPQPIVQETPES